MPSSFLQILDDNHGQFEYEGAGHWTVSNLVQWYQGTSNYPTFASSTAFGTFSLSFEGTSIAFIGNTPVHTLSQVATVSIDGGTPYNITYTTPSTYVQWYQSPTLSDGTHTIVVEHLDGTAVDYALIQVGRNTPLSGKTLVVDNDDPTVQFSGNWQRNTDQFNAGSLPDGFPLHNSTHRSCNPGDAFALGFAGTSVSIYGILNWDNLGSLSATYTLDGSTVTRSYLVTTASPEYMSQDREAINFLYFSLDNLSSGGHTLVVMITECQNSQYIFDYATYAPSFSTLENMSLSPPSSPPSPLSPSQSHFPSSLSGSNNIGSPTGSPNSESTNSSPNSASGTQNSNGNSARTSSKSAPVGAIVGSVIGGLLFLVLVALLLLLIWKRWSRAPSRTKVFKNGTVFPFNHSVGVTPYRFNSGTIADLKRQRADPSSNMRSLRMSSTTHRRTSPEVANAISGASMNLEHMQDQARPPAYDDTTTHLRNTLRGR